MWKVECKAVCCRRDDDEKRHVIIIDFFMMMILKKMFVGRIRQVIIFNEGITTSYFLKMIIIHLGFYN